MKLAPWKDFAGNDIHEERGYDGCLICECPAVA